MSIRPSFERTFLETAMTLSRRSTCERLQVGAVITTPQHTMVGGGFNGSEVGGPNECDRDRMGIIVAGACGHLHAEENSLLRCTHAGPMRLFVTDAPCKMCAKKIVNFSVARGPVLEVFYLRTYRLKEGIHLLIERGIPVHHVALLEDGGEDIHPTGSKECCA